jgi:hypothetical protein
LLEGALCRYYGQRNCDDRQHHFRIFIDHDFPSKYAMLSGMTKKPAPKPDDPAQYKRFVEAAHKAQADETKEGADRAFKKVVSSNKPPTTRST